MNRAVVSALSPGDPNLANNLAERSTLITESGTIDSESNGYVLPGTSLSAADAATTSTFSIPTGGDAVDTALSVMPVAGNQEQVNLLFGGPGNKDRTKPVKLVIDWGTKRICIFLTNCGTLIDPDNEGPQPLQVAVSARAPIPDPGPGLASSPR